jgi:hypothetical protein
MVGLQTPQEVEVPVPPQNDVVVVVAGRHRAADHQKQHLTLRIHHLARLATVLDRRKMLQKAAAAWGPPVPPGCADPTTGPGSGGAAAGAQSEEAGCRVGGGSKAR